MIEVKHLRIVEAIATAGTVTEAAKRLYLTQPAVSHALRDLEKRLGVDLFHRERRRMVPTVEGKRLLKTGHVVLDAVAQLEHDLNRLRHGNAGEIKVTTQCYTGFAWFPGVLSEFARDFPAVEVNLETVGAQDPVDLLTGGEVDLAMVYRTPEAPGIRYEPLFEDPILGIAGPGHPLASKPTWEPEDFASEVLFLHSDPERASILTDFLYPAGVRPRRITMLQLTEAVVAAVHANLGLSAVARWAVSSHLATGTVVAGQLGPTGLTRTWHAATRERDSNRSGLKALVELLRTRPM